MSALVVSALLVPLATALVTALLGRRSAVQRSVSLVGSLAFLGCSVALIVEVLRRGTLRTSLGGWPVPFGIELVADPLSATMVVVTALLGAAVLLFQQSDARPAPASPTLLPMVHVMLASASGAFVTGDLFNLYVWFEMMLASALGLLAYGATSRQLDATLKYFVLNALGTLVLLVGIAYLYTATGHLGFGALATAARAQGTARLTPFIVAVAVAFLVKAGAFPLFAWLPVSYPTLPAPLLALFAGLLTKVGVYALLRLLGGVFPATPDQVLAALRWVAAATMLVGVLGAAHHWDVRRILAFHIVSQIGYMLLGIGLGTDAGRLGTVFYVVHHIVVKANLFLVAAVICRHTGSWDLRRSGGLYASRPALAVLFAIPALSLVGVPPLSGFWAKLLVVREALAQRHHALAGVAIVVGFLTLYSMTKIWLEAFWKKHPDERWRPPERPRLGPAWIAAGTLALVTVAIGLDPELLLRLAAVAAASLGGSP